MSLYPSLEDMQVSKLMQAQNEIINQLNRQSISSNNDDNKIIDDRMITVTTSEISKTSSIAPSSPRPSLSSSSSNSNNFNSQLYPDINNFLGMELTNSMIQANIAQFSQESNNVTQQQNSDKIPDSTVATTSTMMAANLEMPLSGNVKISERANITHGIREVILCKDEHGKIGLRLQSISNGIFIVIVVKNSPASLVGLRFGDQILQLNGKLLAGYTIDKVHKMLKNSPKNNISMIIRDRPFERTVTLMKDSRGDFGFQFENGRIVSIVKNSSAARNGLLTDHNLLEINGQTVVAMKDKLIKKIIMDSDKIIKITIIPSCIYDHMVKKLSTSFLRGIMDHSIPEI